MPDDDEASGGDLEPPAFTEEEPQSQSDGERPYANEEDDDIPDAGAIEEEPSEGSDASVAAPSEQASSSSEDIALVRRHLTVLTLCCRPLLVHTE